MQDNNTAPPPHNIEAEQALLGAILVNNDVMDANCGRLKPEHFFEPLHGRIFAAAREWIMRGDLASAVTLKPLFESDSAMAELGGVRYLARLVGACIGVYSAGDYARAIIDAWTRRCLLEVVTDAAERIRSTDQPAMLGLALEAQIAALTADSHRDPLLVSWRKALVQAMEEACQAYQGEDGSGVKTGIGPLDDVIGGLFPGLTILAGRPSMGKSALAQTIATGVARSGKGVLFASLEMQTSAIAMRAISEHLAMSGVRAPYREARLGRLTEDQMRQFIQATQHIEDLPISLTPPSIRSIDALNSAIRRAARVHEAKGTPLGLVVFDYLQLADSAGSNETERVGAISRALKGTADRLGVPVLALSQLSREVEKRDDKRPMLSDLRSSGQIEQDADVIMFTYRDEYYLERAKPPRNSKDYDAKLLAWHEAMEAARGKMEVIIGKQRMGDIGSVEIAYDMATNSVVQRRKAEAPVDQEAFL